MAYQNVGTPRFYIDYLSYWKSIGLIYKTTGYEGEGTSIEGDFVGLDPVLPCNVSIDTTSVNGTLLYVDLNWGETIGRRLQESMNYVAVLGHNINKPMYAPEDWFFEELGEGIVLGGGSDAGAMRVDFTKRESVDALAHQHDWRGAFVQRNNPSIINAEFLGTGGLGVDFPAEFNQFPNSGVSIYEGEIASVEDEFIGDADRISFPLRWLDPETGNWKPSILGDIFINSISLGHYYDMPISPDLNLSINIEFDGYDSIETLGGSTLTRTRYKGSPKWGELNPWEVGESQGNISRNGRRVWTLKFSLISDNDIFASNYMSNPYLNYNSTNTDYDTNSDLTPNSEGSDDFQYTIEDDDSFSAKVLNFIGNGERFIFQPNNTASNPSDFAICILDQKSLKIPQKAFKAYDISMKIKEVW